MMRFRFAMLVILLGAMPAGAADRAPPIKADYPLDRVAPRVYVVHGPNQMPTPENQGFMNNPGFVVTKSGVVVVDPGSSVQVGEMLLGKIRTVTKAPVVAVFNTHIHGDHWLGNGAIRAAFPKAKLYAHPEMIARTAAEGANWVTLMDRLSNHASAGTRAVAPEIPVARGDRLTIGGLHFRVHHSGKAHTDGDIMIEVVEEKAMFLGDNAMRDRVGRLDDGDLRGNIEALDMALATSAERYVPGHGKTGGREVPQAYREWLDKLYAAVKKYRAQGLSDFEMKDQVIAELATYKSWSNFDAEIGKLISLVWLQAEREDF
jgi:glyoxylase-like metal-dependent hydrolase (beta-lactamase superfamily II)